MEASSITQNSSTGNDHEQDHGSNHDGSADSNPEINRVNPEISREQEQEQVPEQEHELEQAQEQEQEQEKEQEKEQKQEQEQDEEQVRRVLQVISATGNFWDNWDKLKSMLSYQLKLVLSEYPEAKLTVDEQNAVLGETYLDLVTRLDEELHCFIEGPPFTLQRICEILLAARSIYPKLSKLALALEKNLLVTSTLTVCTKPYPDMIPNPEPEKESEESQPESNSIQNGVEPMAGDGDEIMTEVEEDIEEMTIDMDALQEIVGPPEANSTATKNS